MLDKLGQILEQRAELRLEFCDSAVCVQSLAATLVKFNDRGAILEVPALGGLPEVWVGAEISCFFCLRDEACQGGAQLRSFNSRIHRVHRQPGGAALCVLPLPKAIHDAQRRRSVRVKVDMGKVPVLKLWRELSPRAVISGQHPLLNSEHDAKRGLTVGNISAKGLGLQLPEPLMQKVMPGQEKGESFVFYFKAVAQGSSPAADFWVQAVLRSIYANPRTGDVGLGFEFIAEGVLNKARRLDWSALKLHEVSGLGRFIFKWNLDFYREKAAGEA
ncbi:MAG: hypothetical protein KKA55_10110 [Proteobacteria bacterium]|nr:hypothetical protein [Pseudomonadota bacterium]MBU1595870.1 hypothetical protein [Pseudomonadota bacterium]